MLTIRFEDIYFADQYNYIYNSYFFSSLHNVRNWKNFRKMLVYGIRQRYITCHVESDQVQGLFYRTLPWRNNNLNEMIYRCDTYEAVSARPKRPDDN